jgi:hypothetical protein
MVNAIANPASDKQVSFIKSLIAGRAVPALVLSELEKVIGNPAELDKSDASALIESLLELPMKSTQGAVELEVGMYQLGGEIYKVKRSEESGNLYASVLVGTKFEYARGAIRTLTPEHRLSLEQAKAYGVQYGICCVCGRLLTNEVSVAEGIGPICSGRL